MLLFTNRAYIKPDDIEVQRAFPEEMYRIF